MTKILHENAYIEIATETSSRKTFLSFRIAKIKIIENIHSFFSNIKFTSLETVWKIERRRDSGSTI